MSNDAEALQRLAGLVRQRRADLVMSKVAVAAEADMSANTYMKIEDGKPLRETTYRRIEAVLGWAAGSCRAILDGAASPVQTVDGPSDTGITHIPEEDLGQAFTSALVAVSETLTAPEIREISRKVVEELKRRGLLTG